MKVCYVNVYQKPDGGQMIGGGFWSSRRQADYVARATLFHRLYRIRVTTKVLP